MVPLVRLWIRYLSDPMQGENAIPKEVRGNVKNSMTKADCFIGRGRNSVWLGSVGSHGRPEMLNREIVLRGLQGSVQESAMVRTLAQGVSPEMGWPWRNGRITEYTYAFDDGEIFVSV
jgi:hypothetical protein